MKSRADILIFDVPDRRSIPVVGSLGRQYNMHYLIPIRKGFALQSLVELGLWLFKPRHTRSMHFVAFNDEKDLYSGLHTFLQRKHFDLVMAFSERSTALLCQNAAELEKVTRIAHGSFEDFNTLNDKYAILEVCQRVGVPTPRFVGLESEKDIQKAAKLKFPLVVKCRLASGVKEAFRICRNIKDIQTAFNELTAGNSNYSYFPCDKLVAEEFIKGKIFDAGFVVDNGRVTAAVAQERIWTIPPEGGYGAYNITRDIPELVEYGEKIFGEIKWKGPAQLEFIYDEDDQTYKLIEINPRYWGTTGLAIKAGVNVGEHVIRVGLKGQEEQKEQPEQQVEIAPAGIDFSWLLQETLTAEKLRGEKGNLVWKHIKRIFSPEINNFSYSFGTNILLALPHILSDPKVESKDSNTTASLAKRLFE